MLFGFSLVATLASMTLLNPSLDMILATRSWDVPMLSRVRDWILEMWTPISRWIPEHSMQIITPKFVDSQVASERRRKINNKLKVFREGKKEKEK